MYWLKRLPLCAIFSETFGEIIEIRSNLDKPFELISLLRVYIIIWMSKDSVSSLTFAWCILRSWCQGIPHNSNCQHSVAVTSKDFQTLPSFHIPASVTWLFFLIRQNSVFKSTALLQAEFLNIINVPILSIKWKQICTCITLRQVWKHNENDNDPIPPPFFISDH